MELNKQKCQKLLIGIVGIYSLYFVGSVIQERIMKIPYENQESGEMDTFQNSNAFILFPSLVSWIIGYAYNTILKPTERKLEVPQISWIKSSFLILLGALSMTKAIYLTSYPMVTLFKSCNLLSVLVIGIFFSRVKDKSQKLEKKQFMVGIIVTIGVLLYNLGPIHQYSGKQMMGSYFGLALLFFSLICDGLIPDYQAEIKTKYKPSPLEMFEHMNKWKTILSFTYSIFTVEISSVVLFFIDHPLCFFHLLCLSLTGAVGQIFIYWMISNFRQHVVPFIITTRKILTVVISIIYFGHDVTIFQKAGIALVFIAVFFEFIGEVNSGSFVKNQSLLNKDKNIMKPQVHQVQSLLNLDQAKNQVISVVTPVQKPNDGQKEGNKSLI